jgi:hypothetical protein
MIGIDVKVSVVAYFNVIWWPLSGVTEENQENPSVRIVGGPGGIRTNNFLHISQRP